MYIHPIYSLSQMLQPQKEAHRSQCASRLLGQEGFGISPLPPTRRAAMYRFSAFCTARRKEELRAPERM